MSYWGRTRGTPRIYFGAPLDKLEVVAGGGGSGEGGLVLWYGLGCCHLDRAPDKWKKKIAGWMEVLLMFVHS